jgi:hypothetical protein
MVQPNSSLGISANFPSADVRNALLFAMQMGAPNEVNEDDKRQVRFLRRNGTVTYYRQGSSVPLALSEFRRDRDGNPLDATIRMETTPDEEILVDVAIDLEEATAEELPVGNFRPVKATITLMAEEYAQIIGCREVIYNNDRYGYAYELTANGLFDLTFHTLIFFAIDES